MAGGVVHDFNNALMAVIGYSELLLKNQNLIEDKNAVREYLEVIHGAGRDASDVIGRLRDFYRPRGETDVFEPVDLNKLLENAAIMTQPKWKSQALATGRTITVDFDFEKIRTVVANSGELREAVTNLIFNAVDAMPRGGTITLRTRQQTDGVLVEVSDTGNGMSEEVKNRCLEPFFSTKGEKGSGLGLSMVFGIIKRHEGTLNIESSTGSGTTFQIHLPFHIAAQVVMEEKADASGDSLHILVADDDPVSRDIITKYLISDSHRVSTFASGTEALKGFAEGAFDLLILDHGMPGMSGIELAGLAKQMRNGQPIILLTGFNESALPPKIQETGVDLVLHKPVSLEELRHAMAAVLREET